MKRRRLLAASLGLALGGCALRPQHEQPALYDFGIDAPIPRTKLGVGIALAAVSANPWLQTPAIVYRLAYRDAAQLHPYARSRWAAPPAELIELRWRHALGEAAGNRFSMVADGLATDHLLRVHVEAFEQVVDSERSARALVRMLARLASTDRRRGARRVFEAVEPCPSVDAPGSVQALKIAADRAIAEMIAWIAAETAATASRG